MEGSMSIVRVEKECTIKCDFCWTRIQPGTEYYVNMIGAGVDAEEEYRCQDCEEVRVKNMYGKLYPYA